MGPRRVSRGDGTDDPECAYVLNASMGPRRVSRGDA